MIIILRQRVARNNLVATLNVVSCPAHNFVIWSWVSILFHINDYHIEMTCRAQNLGRYLEGQGHSMTFQQNRFRPITLLFEVDLKTISCK